MTLGTENWESRVGILGGTFDPIHNGHIVLAAEVRARRSLGRILFVPAKQPPHKTSRALARAADRLRMIQLAIADYPPFEVSDLELQRPGVSYSIDTLRQLHEIYGENVRLEFIIGSDTVSELSTWKEVSQLPDVCEIVVATRPGFSLSAIGKLSKIFLPAQVDRIRSHTVEIPALDVSSTAIRRRQKKELPISGMVPTGVERYIQDHQLYR